MTQYSKRMVIVHWLTLIALIAAWFLGESVHEARHDGSMTIAGYVFHASLGGLVLLMSLTRIYFRSKDGTPPAAGHTVLDKIAKGIHHLLYTLLVLLPVSGMMQVATTDIGKALMAGDATLLPKKIHGVFAHEVHEVLVKVLIVVVIIHFLAALYHQFVIKDGLMDRMMLRKK